MDRPLYFDREGAPVEQERFYALKMEPGYFRIGLDKVEGYEVSTVWVGHDMGFDGDPPIIFETMVSGPGRDEGFYRYATEDEARAGHERVVAELRLLGEARE